MMNPKEYMKIAYQLAHDLSDDPTTKNGAVLLDSTGNIIGKGANRIPQGLRKTSERMERPEKYFYFIHAEQDAIANAAYNGVSTYNSLLYCPWAACTSCAQLIIQCGIKKLVTHKAAMERTPTRWKESVEKAIGMLTEAGVVYESLEIEICGVEGLIDGIQWTP
jgi:dCMP deaminase